MATNPTYATGLLAGSSAYTPAVQESTAQATWTPTQRVVKPEELAQTQLANITAANSPLMQQAKTTGLQQAQQRGLLSSSLAAGAAQGEMLRAATPIALQDASTYSQAGGQTFEASSQAGQFNAAQAAQQGADNAAAVNRAAELAAAQKYDLEQLNTEYGLRNAQLQLQNDVAKEQAQLAQGNDLQKSYVSQVGQMMNNYMNGWFRIQESEMTPEEKTVALGEYNNTLRTWQTVTNTAYGSMPQWEDQWGAVLV